MLQISQTLAWLLPYKATNLVLQIGQALARLLCYKALIWCNNKLKAFVLLHHKAANVVLQKNKHLVGWLFWDLVEGKCVTRIAIAGDIAAQQVICSIDSQWLIQDSATMDAWLFLQCAAFAWHLQFIDSLNFQPYYHNTIL